ncbi:MAG: SDR family NAD(P)-dependent oxidoreductase [Pseudomonadota bacterium]
MSQFENKTAVISGGAEGIGLSIARAVGQQGMNVVLGDIDANQLEQAQKLLEQEGVAVLTVPMDVTSLEQWQNLADQAIERFGKIHMMVNNAGVASAGGPVETTNHSDWNWVVDVNLMGVLRGTQVVVPKIKEHGEGGWVVNVASMAGMAGIPYAGAYTATKVAVVGMSESWQVELAEFGIKVSVLCPAFVQTRIHLSHRNRQAAHQDPNAGMNADSDNPASNAAKELVENGIPVEIVGKRVVEALQAGEFYIFTHPNHRAQMRQRFEAIDQAFARAAESPLLADIVDQEVVSLGTTFGD